MAASASKAVVATACKATTPQHAVIRLYDSRTWQPILPPLEGHTLTITRIAWSHDDRYLISVSRDRYWRVFSGASQTGKLCVSSSPFGPSCMRSEAYTSVSSAKAHGRVIWDCAWIPNSYDFATASRDKTASLSRVLPSPLLTATGQNMA
jgi:elongator complex protein 2